MAAALLDPAAPAPGGARFAVHRNNVVAGLVTALGEAYPAVRRLVGEDFFRAAAALFVRTHPPRSPVMLLYGAEFPDWIAAFPPAGGLPYLPDVARLERAWLEAFHAADAEPIDGAQLAAIPAARVAAVRFRPHPSLRLVASIHPIVSLRAGSPANLAAAETAVVARPGVEVSVRDAAPGEATLLAALLRGAPFGALAEVAAGGAFDLAAELRAAFARGLVAAIEE